MLVNLTPQHVVTMTREQLINHLTLCGWVPVANQNSRASLKRGDIRVFIIFGGKRLSVHHISMFGADWGFQEQSWDDLQDEHLQLMAQEIAELPNDT